MLCLRIGSGQMDIPFEEGKVISMASRDIQFERPMDIQEFLSGACFGKASSASMSYQASSTALTLKTKKFVSPAMSTSLPLRLSSKPALQNVEVIDIPDDADDKVKHEESHWTANW